MSFERRHDHRSLTDTFLIQCDTLRSVDVAEWKKMVKYEPPYTEVCVCVCVCERERV